MKFVRYVSLLALFVVLTISGLAQTKHPKQTGQPNQSAAQPADNAPRPHLEIETLTHDFGELKAGTPLRYAFKIKNAGKADLIIESVSPG